jgi:hypothetical protein
MSPEGRSFPEFANPHLARLQGFAPQCSSATLKFESHGVSFRGEDAGRRPVAESPESSNRNR